jgi:hypothetical protein
MPTRWLRARIGPSPCSSCSANLPMATVSPVLHASCAWRRTRSFASSRRWKPPAMTRRDRDKSYLLTDKRLHIAQPKAGGKNLVEESLTVMKQLRDETTESVFLTVRCGHECALIRQIPALSVMKISWDLDSRQVVWRSRAAGDRGRRQDHRSSARIVTFCRRSSQGAPPCFDKVSQQPTLPKGERPCFCKISDSGL